MAEKTLLLVEDNTALRMVYKDQLVRDGYKVLEAPTAQEALDILLNNLVDLLLLDILLPDKNGLVFLEELRQNERFLKLPVIMLTSLPDEVAFDKSRDLNISGYLVKDHITPTQISEHVNHALAEKVSS